MLTGKFFYVEVEDEATVGGLKREIARKEEVEESRLLLVDCSGNPLQDDDRALAAYDCCDGSIVRLIVLPVGDLEWPQLLEDWDLFHVDDDDVDDDG
ncbi:hypothetical protein GW17_00020437 [Ensete ventricosum]|nr:hypothetical protein GW17_00020437 [Ensete ventricosum]